MVKRSTGDLETQIPSGAEAASYGKSSAGFDIAFGVIGLRNECADHDTPLRRQN